MSPASYAHSLLYLFGGANQDFADADMFGLSDGKGDDGSDILASQGRDAVLGLLLGLPHLGISDVLPQFGGHHPRLDHRHTDMLLGDLLAQGLGERAHRPLGSIVAAVACLDLPTSY